MQMRELNHENVNSFIGLGQELIGVSLLWTYCDKGSLYDLLGNDELKLDSNFVISFAQDIAQVIITLLCIGVI